MADMKNCWLKTAHEHHGWTEVDGKVVSMVDASTALSLPGARYHHCEGVKDVQTATELLPKIIPDPYSHHTKYRLYEHTVGGITVRAERLITLTGIYQRVVREDTEWQLMQALTCFCCSCDRPGDDWACRNHNVGWGMRPCEQHGVDGQVEIDPETEIELGMPDSVQVERARRDAQVNHD